MWPQVCLCTPYAPPMHRGKVRTQARQAARYAPHSPTASHNATSLEACTSRARLDPPHRRAASSRDMISSTSPMPEALSIGLIGCQTLRQVFTFFYAAQLMTPTQLNYLSRVFHRGRHLPPRSPTRFSLRRNFSAVIGLHRQRIGKSAQEGARSAEVGRGWPISLGGSAGCIRPA